MSTKPPRRKKTARERAEEALGIADRRVKKLREEATRRRVDLAAVESDLADAEARLAYAKKDPALPQTPSTGQSTTSNQSGDTTA